MEEIEEFITEFNSQEVIQTTPKKKRVRKRKAEEANLDHAKHIRQDVATKIQVPEQLIDLAMSCTSDDNDQEDEGEYERESIFYYMTFFQFKAIPYMQKQNWN